MGFVSLASGPNLHTRRRKLTQTAASLVCALAALAVAWTGEAHAQAGGPDETQLSRVMRLLEEQEQRLDAQQQVLEQQQRQLSEQRALIERQRAELAGLTGVSDNELGEMRAAGAPLRLTTWEMLGSDQPVIVPRGRSLNRWQTQDRPGDGAAPAQTPATRPEGPVGEAPPEAPPTRVQALPEEASVLTAPGDFTLDVGVEYSHASTNRLVFRGVEIVTGIQVGLIEASEASRDTVGGTFAARYGITRRLEAEVRVPYMQRWDRVKTLAQRDEQVTRTLNLRGGDIGDVEVGLRYQLNNGRNGWPIFVAGVRYKLATGTGPFDIPRDEFGVATELATGSGFQSVQAGLSMIYPSDPVVLFANVAYTYSMPDDIDQEIADVMVGRVDPGDSISAGLGFGFALNRQFSYSLGYSHTYVMETESEIGDTLQRSTSVQVGSLSLGMSFRFNEDHALNASFDFGVTEDAPDVRIAFRTPFSF
ncbi:MAG: transporter [Hyphomonadaceae bacterium]